MSAGTGIYHSEFNASTTEDINLFQLWIFPNRQEVAPRYQQMAYEMAQAKDQFLQLVSPNPEDEGLWIYQDAWIHLIDMEANTSKTYTWKRSGNGVYAMNIEGIKAISGQNLGDRDALGVWETDSIEIQAKESGRLLLIEVPMQF
jgi:redox-sensitive bicupin YhaK (pirin superfamily)